MSTDNRDTTNSYNCICPDCYMRFLDADRHDIWIDVERCSKCAKYKQEVEERKIACLRAQRARHREKMRRKAYKIKRAEEKLKKL